MATEKPMRISISVTSDDPNIITRGSEAFSRAAAGLALEGIDVFMLWQQDDEDEGVEELETPDWGESPND